MIISLKIDTSTLPKKLEQELIDVYVSILSMRKQKIAIYNREYQKEYRKIK